MSRCVQNCPRGCKKVANREEGSQCVKGKLSNLRVFQFQLKSDSYGKFRFAVTFLNPLTPRVSLVILLTACFAIPMMSVRGIWYWIN